MKMSYTDEDLQEVFKTVKSMNELTKMESKYRDTLNDLSRYYTELDELYRSEPDDFDDFGISVVAVKMKIACSQCGEVISEAEIEREENSKIIYCHQEGIRIDNVCCEECGNDLVDVDIEIEICAD
jgi:hypothetical protein